jgi:hypothetical protein
MAGVALVDLVDTRIAEVVKHGFGEVTVKVQDHKVVRVVTTKSDQVK